MLPTTSQPNGNLNLNQELIINNRNSNNHWIKYRDTFESQIHNNDVQIINIKKFHYLNSSLKGAARVIQCLDVSESNYCIDIIKKKIQRQKIIET